MYFGKIVLLASLSGTIPTTMHAKPIKLHCPANWPSQSQEKCQYEGEEHGPKAVGSKSVRRDFPRLTNVIYFGDVIDKKRDMTTNNMTVSPIDLKSELEDAAGDSVTTYGVAGSPTWPTKWTKLPCCQLTCACSKYLSAPENAAPNKGSEGWKKAMCCYQHMLKDPACANPPAFERFKPISPPWCLS